MNMGQYLATGLTVSLFVKKNYKDVELSQINTAISSLYPLELFTEDHQERHFWGESNRVRYKHPELRAEGLARHKSSQVAH